MCACARARALDTHAREHGLACVSVYGHCRSDVALIARDCALFNGSGAEITACANRVVAALLRAIPDTADVVAPVPPVPSVTSTSAHVGQKRPRSRAATLDSASEAEQE
ncbi:hypothetical protein EON67_10955, partial [archaeon]